MLILYFYFNIVYYVLLTKNYFNISSFSGGRKIDVQGSSMDSVESALFRPSNKVLQIQYSKSSGVRLTHRGQRVN